MTFSEEKMKKFFFKLLSKPSLSRTNLREVLEAVKDLLCDLDVKGIPFWMKNITLERLESHAKNHPFFVQPMTGIAGYREEIKEGVKVEVENQYHYKSILDTFKSVVMSDPETRLSQLQCDKQKILSEGEYFKEGFCFYFHIFSNISFSLRNLQ